MSRMASEPIERWRDLLADAPRAATLDSSVRTDATGRSVVSLGYGWVGDLTEARAYLWVFRGIGYPWRSRSASFDTSNLQTQFDQKNTHGIRRYSKGHYLTELTDAAIDAYLARGVDTAAADTDWTRVPGGGLELHGGAIADVPETRTAYSGRGALLEWGGAPPGQIPPRTRRASQPPARTAPRWSRSRAASTSTSWATRAKPASDGRIDRTSWRG